MRQPAPQRSSRQGTNEMIKLGVSCIGVGYSITNWPISINIQCYEGHAGYEKFSIFLLGMLFDSHIIKHWNLVFQVFEISMYCDRNTARCSLLKEFFIWEVEGTSYYLLFIYLISLYFFSFSSTFSIINHVPKKVIFFFVLSAFFVTTSVILRTFIQREYRHREVRALGNIFRVGCWVVHSLCIILWI